MRTSLFYHLVLLLFLNSKINSQGTAATQTGPALRNYYNQIMQINFLRNRVFNTTLNNTDEFYLNHQVYPFQWDKRSGMFSRLPFPANITFFDCSGFRPEIARVATPLKNRFIFRELNITQMECPLYVRIIENNHYFGKYNRIVLEFKSPCLTYNIYKYILNKNGLRTTLQLTIFEQEYVFQFNGAVNTRVGRSRAEAYRQYRLLRPNHHPIHVTTNKYRSNNSTNDTFFLRGAVLTPDEIFAIQVNALTLLNDNYLQKMQIYHQHDQNNTFATRNETFPRKTVGANEETNEQKVDENKILRHNDFKFSRKTKKASQRVLRKLFGKNNLLKFRKQFAIKIEELLEKVMMKNGADIGILKKIKKRSRERKLKQVRAKSHSKKSNKSKKDRKVKDVNQKRNLWHNDPELRHQNSWWFEQTVQTIIANEPYKVETCQRICTPTEYYHSWDFCLRVCGINYNFLTNRNDLFGGIDLYPNVPFINIARRFYYLPTNRPENAVFTYNEIQGLKFGNDVISCDQTWRTLRCNFADPPESEQDEA